MKLDTNKIIKRASDLYIQYQVEEGVPIGRAIKLRSRQVRAAITAIIEAINQNK